MQRTPWIITTLAVMALVLCLTFRATSRSSIRETQTTANSRLPAAPNFTLQDLAAKDVSLTQFKGKVVLVNFWATWCTPCRVEIPWFIELQEKYGAQGFTVLGVAMDDEGKRAVAPFVQNERFTVNGADRPMNYPILLGTDAATQPFGGLLGVPTSVLISKEGKVVKREDGLVNYSELDKAIQSQLEH
ncbi:MAG: TlpA family protein disulfide reductase [Acidobacteria bacterium]|nr:TlpA family protein disulfide reductase [Acidobacteriota bacterium]